MTTTLRDYSSLGTCEQNVGISHNTNPLLGQEKCSGISEISENRSCGKI